jgi:hypothetical protein
VADKIMQIRFACRAIAFALLLVCSAVRAEEQERQRISVACLAIKPINCSPDIAVAVEEMLMGKLFETNLFILMEKAQVERIAARQGLANFDITDNEQLVRLGRQLKVDKVVAGSISRIDGYRLDIRTIDTAKGTVDISNTTEVDNERAIEKGVARTVETFERFYLGFDKISGNFDMSLSPSLFIPHMKLNDGILYGRGAQLVSSLNNVLFENVSLQFSAGAYNCVTREKRVEAASFYPFEFGAAYSYRFTKTLTMRTGISAGLLVSQLNYDTDGYMTNGSYQYEKGTFSNFMISFRSEFSFFIHNRWFLVISPEYVLLPEKSGMSSYGLISIGPKAMF